MWKEDFRNSPSSKWEIKDVKRKLFRAVANVNILEGIRFYVSFACSFAFGELKLMEGSAKIISLIARDENQHLAITQNILNKWRSGDDPEMQGDHERRGRVVVRHVRQGCQRREEMGRLSVPEW